MMKRRGLILIVAMCLIAGACATPRTGKKITTEKAKKPKAAVSEEALSYSLVDDVSVDSSIIRRGKRYRGGY